MEGNIPLSYEGLPRGFNPRVINTCPQDRHETSLTLPAIIRNNLGRIATTTLCAIAANGMFSANSAAQDAETTIRKGRVVGVAKTHTEAYRTRVEECGDPSADAPIRKQLRTMRCLHALTMPNQKATSGTSLSKSARRKTNDILKPNCTFRHKACKKPFDAYIAKKFSGRGENLAWGEDEKGSAQATFAAWMRSRPHRNNLLKHHWDRFGIAMAKNGRRNYWTAHFGYFNKGR